MLPIRLRPCFATLLSTLGLLTAAVPAQTSGFAPNIGNGTAIASTAYPWNRGRSSVRVQYVYDASEVPGNGTIVIFRVKFRPNDALSTTTTWVGGTYGFVEVRLSNAAVAYNALTTSFAGNHGSNMASVYKGTVSLLPGAGTGANIPSKPYVDITLQQPFIYDPSKGPLLLDVAIDGSQWQANPGGTASASCACTYTGDPKKVARMYNLSSHTATTGSVQATVGLVMELFHAGGGIPGITTIGSSCSDGFNNSGEFYTQQSPTVGNANFDLRGRTLPPSAAAMLFLGLDPNFKSFGLGAAGAPGCFLHTAIVLQVGLQTTAGTPSLSNGTLVVPAPIPNNVTLKGAWLSGQLAVADSNSLRPLPVVFTNGLGITIQ